MATFRAFEIHFDKQIKIGNPSEQDRDIWLDSVNVRHLQMRLEDAEDKIERLMTVVAKQQEMIEKLALAPAQQA